MTLPEYRAGDSVWPGRPVAEIIEGGRMELRGKVDENDRANLTEGQQAKVEIDALPGEPFNARVGALSAQAKRADWMETSIVGRQFDISFQFDQVDPRMKAARPHE